MRVRVVQDGAVTLRVEPDAADVRLAASKLRSGVHAVAAEAVAAWERLQAAPSRAGARRSSSSVQSQKGADGDED